MTHVPTTPRRVVVRALMAATALAAGMAGTAAHADALANIQKAGVVRSVGLAESDASAVAHQSN